MKAVNGGGINGEGAMVREEQMNGWEENAGVVMWEGETVRKE